MERDKVRSRKSTNIVVALFILMPILLVIMSMGVGVNASTMGGRGGHQDFSAAIIGTPVPPYVQIIYPATLSNHYLHDLIFFSGYAFDHIGGENLSDQLIWTSDIDGLIGTGEAFTRSDLSPGVHTITASVTSPLGSSNLAQSIITVFDTPYSIEVYSGSPQSAFRYSEFSLPLSAIVKDPDGNPMEGVTVTFTAPTGVFADSSLPVTTAVSDVNGIATSALFRGDQTYLQIVVMAEIPYPAAPAEFILTSIWPFDTYYAVPSCEAYRYYAVVTGDFNSDGRKDVAVPVQISFGTYGLYVHLQNLDGTLADPVIYSTGEYPRSITVGDFNDDDLDDISVGFYNDNQVGVYLQNSSGTLENYVTYDLNGYAPTSIDAGDLNNDGLQDLVVSLNTAKIGVLLQQSDGSLGTMVEYSASETLYDELGVGDLNHDGLADAVKAAGDPHLSLFLQNEFGTLDSEITYGNSTYARGVSVGDVDGDGRDDVVMVVVSGLDGYLAVYQQNLSGTLDAAVLFEDDYGAIDVEMGDVNFNGLNDVVISYEDPGYSIYFQTPTGSLAGYWWHWSVPYTYTMDRQGLALGDVTGDGLIDIVLLDREEGLSIIPHAVLSPPPDSVSGNISASDGILGKVDIIWDEVEGAETYNLFRDDSPSGSGMQLYAGGLESLMYSDPATIDWTVYYYWVEACNPSGCGPIGGPDGGYSASLLLDDGFETGDFSAWTRYNDGGGFLYACGEAAMHGLWGACVERGDNDKRKQLIDDSPANETFFAARFNLDLHNLSMSDGERFRFMQTKMDAERPFFIVLKYDDGNYYMQLVTKLDDLTKVKSNWYRVYDQETMIEVNWVAASGPGANDGYAELYVSGGLLLEALTGLDNDTLYITSFRMGFTSRLEGKSISGIFYIDDVATSNGGFIGLP